MHNMTLNLVLGLMASFGHVHTAHAAPWRVELLEQPGTVNYDLDSDRPRLTATNDGSLLAYPLNTRLRDNLDEDGYSAFARFGTTGATETFSTGTLGANASGTLLADGSLVTVATTIERVASDGSNIWSVLNPIGVDYGSVIQISNDALLLAVPYLGRMQLRRLTLSNGAVTDALDAGVTSGYCLSAPMAGDGTGLVFVGDACFSRGIVKVLDSPLRLDTNWQASSGNIVSADLRFDGGALYAVVNADNRGVLRKFDPMTGATLWTYPATVNQLSVEGQFDVLPGVVILRMRSTTFGPSIQRIDPATGTFIWLHPPVLEITTAAAAGGILVVGGTKNSTGNVEDARGFFQIVSMATGAGSPTTTLVAPQGAASTLSGLAFLADQIVALGAGCRPGLGDPPSCDATLWRYDLDMNLAPVLVEADAVKVRTGNAQIGVLESPPTQPVIATLEMGSEGPQIHIRRFASSDGATTLNIVTPVQMSFPWRLPEYVRVIPTGDGNFAALLTIRYRYARNSDAVVVKIDGNTGAQMWRRSMLDFSRGPSDVEIQRIASDSAGNIILDVAHEYLMDVREKSVIKLGSATGEVVWDVPLATNLSSIFHSDIAQMLGDDVLIYSDPSVQGGAGWQRLRGTDGSVVWSVPSFPIFPTIVGDGYIYGTRYSGNAVTVGRIDPQTGATVCTGTHVSVDDTTLSNSALPLLGSDGDIYVAGRRRSGTTGTTFKVVIVKFSGSSCEPVWANRLDAVTSPGAFFAPWFVENGLLYLSGRPVAFDAVSANVLMTLATADGSVQGSQFLYRGGLRDASSVRASGFPFGLDTDGGLILMAASREPSQPTRTVVEKRAAPASAVVGALHITADMVAAPMAGSAGFNFVISVINDGATPAPNVRTVVNFGIDVRLENVTCSLAGSPCQASVVGSTVRSTSNVPVGATLTLAGRVSVPSASTAQISLTGSAFSPYGFSEMNLADNILPVMVPFRDYIFRNGVESTP